MAWCVNDMALTRTLHNIRRRRRGISSNCRVRIDGRDAGEMC